MRLMSSRSVMSSADSMPASASLRRNRPAGAGEHLADQIAQPGQLELRALLGGHGLGIGVPVLLGGVARRRPHHLGSVARHAVVPSGRRRWVAPHDTFRNLTRVSGVGASTRQRGAVASEVTVGIDIGTTSVKAVAVDGDGRVLARARVPHPLKAAHAASWPTTPASPGATACSRRSTR